MPLSTVSKPQPRAGEYDPLGGCREAMVYRGPECIVSGPAGTGKSRGCLEKINLCCSVWKGMRALIARKTRESLTQSALVTFNKQVLTGHPPVLFHHETQEYRYPNGSIVVVGGLDKTSKIMSSEYDLIYIQEARECTEADWEDLSTRLRNHVMPYQQMLGDTNPDAPTHWIKQRANSGKLRLIESRHEDNPTVTPEYLATLDALTGVRYKRLRLGLWVAAEGQVYEEWDPAIHLVDRFEIPAEWPRYLCVDFGYTNPFVCQWWAMDTDGRLWRYRELYRTQRLVEDHAKQIRELSKGERIRGIVCDHDAEDRATLSRHLGLETSAAIKDVSPGIQAVGARLRKAGDGKTRLLFLRDSLVERDPLLAEKKLPTCTEEEPEGYVWDTSNGKKIKEEPLKLNDHGLDATRYMVAAFDLATVERRRKVKWG